MGSSAPPGSWPRRPAAPRWRAGWRRRRRGTRRTSEGRSRSGPAIRTWVNRASRFPKRSAGPTSRPSASRKRSGGASGPLGEGAALVGRVLLVAARLDPLGQQRGARRAGGGALARDGARRCGGHRADVLTLGHPRPPRPAWGPAGRLDPAPAGGGGATPPGRPGGGRVSPHPRPDPTAARRSRDSGASAPPGGVVRAAGLDPARPRAGGFASRFENPMCEPPSVERCP